MYVGMNKAIVSVLLFFLFGALYCMREREREREREGGRGERERVCVKKDL